MSDINILLQTDERLPKAVNKTGCYWRSLLAMIEIHFGFRYTARELTKLYNRMVKKKVIRKNCYVFSSSSLLNFALKKRSLKIWGRRLGSIKNGEIVWRKDLPIQAKYVDFIIPEFQTPYKWKDEDGVEHFYSHFVLYDKDGNLVYNPDPNIQMVKKLKAKTYGFYKK